ncbi:hypothetical protein NPIL_307171 [Nephila pilipes]|uniref:Uncharacterized protein n=1 Tax=Nephila pilipes TaxID=299642 RepID=A0A8X6QL18_NEPPI|nr:hypothetical protein NPIL_307171 [Nephila pilipes]
MPYVENVVFFLETCEYKEEDFDNLDNCRRNCNVDCNSSPTDSFDANAIDRKSRIPSFLNPEKRLQSNCELGIAGSFYHDDITEHRRKRVTCCNDESGASTGGVKAKLNDFPDVQLYTTRTFSLDFAIARSVSVEHAKEGGRLQRSILFRCDFCCKPRNFET